MPGPLAKLVTLKRSAEFRRIRGGVRWRCEAFLIEGRRRDGTGGSGDGTPLGARFGFTITRKIGNAVVRNRIRRRLREALRAVAPGLAHADFDYVVVASRAAHDYPFAGLQDALREAFERLHRQPGGGDRRGNRAKQKPSGKRAEPMPARAGLDDTTLPETADQPSERIQSRDP